MPLTDKELKEILSNQTDLIAIDIDTWKLGIKYVKEKYKNEIEKNKSQHNYFSIEQKNIRDKIQKLIDMRSNEELTKDESLEQKNKLLSKLALYQKRTNDSNFSLKTWLELTEDFFNTAFQIRDVINNGQPDEKQKILSKIGENFILKDKKITFSFKKSYDVLLSQRFVQTCWR